MVAVTFMSSPQPSTGAARIMGAGRVVSTEWKGQKITNADKNLFSGPAFSEMNVYWL